MNAEPTASDDGSPTVDKKQQLLAQMKSWNFKAGLIALLGTLDAVGIVAGSVLAYSAGKLVSIDREYSWQIAQIAFTLWGICIPLIFLFMWLYYYCDTRSRECFNATLWLRSGA